MADFGYHVLALSFTFSQKLFYFSYLDSQSFDYEDTKLDIYVCIDTSVLTAEYKDMTEEYLAESVILYELRGNSDSLCQST